MLLVRKECARPWPGRYRRVSCPSSRLLYCSFPQTSECIILEAESVALREENQLLHTSRMWARAY
jgi:hypothetical protein